MLIFVYGDDNFRVCEKISQLKSAFCDKHDPLGRNIEVFDATDGKFDTPIALQSISTIPFLSKHRMVIVRNLLLSAKKNLSSFWETGLQHIPDSTIVVLWENAEAKVVEKKSLFNVLKALSNTHLYIFDELTGTTLTKWIMNRIKMKNGMIEPHAVRALIEFIGSDLWKMNFEIEKLIAFGNGKTITETMVKELVNTSFEGKIFELVDALSKQDAHRTVQMLEEERLAGSDDYYILSMFTRQIRLLIGARSILDTHPHADKDLIASELGVHPFVATKIFTQAKNFKLEKLLHAHNTLFSFDQGVKNGNMTIALAVDLLAVELLK